MLAPGQAHFWPQEYNLNNFVEVYLVMQHTKYQGSRPCGFWQEDFLKFSSWKSILACVA